MYVRVVCWSLLLLFHGNTWGQSPSRLIRQDLEQGRKFNPAQNQMLLQKWTALSVAQLQDSLADFPDNEAGLHFRLVVWTGHQRRNSQPLVPVFNALEQRIKLGGYKQLYPSLYLALGTAAFFERDLRQVEREYRKMLDYLDELPPKERLPFYQAYVNYCFYNKKDYQEAITYLEKMQLVAEQEEIPGALQVVYELSAHIYSLWGNYEQADFYASKMLTAEREAPFSKATALLHKSNWAAAQGNWAQVEQYLEAVRPQLKLEQAPPARLSPSYRMVYGKYFYQKMRYHWARRDVKPMQAFFDSELFSRFFKIAIPEDQNKVVELYLQFCLQRNYRAGVLDVLNSFEAQMQGSGNTLLRFSPSRVEGYLYVQEPQKALALIDYTLEALQGKGKEAQTWLMPDVAIALLQQKAQLFATGTAAQQAQRTDLYRQALRLLPSVQEQHDQESYKKQFFQKYQPLLHEAMAFFWKQGQQSQDPIWAEEGFRVAEQNKANLLQDALQAYQAKQGGLLPDSLYQKERQIQQRIVFLRTALREAERQGHPYIEEQEKDLFREKERLEQLKKQLAADYPRYYTWRYEQKELSLAAFQAQLPDSLLVLELFETPTQLYLFYIDNKKLQWRRIPQNAAAKTALQHYLKTLRQWSPSFQEQQAGALLGYAWQSYQELLQPVLNRAEYNSLWVIADGQWSYLPFETLLDAPPNSSLGTASYLIRRYTIAYQYSAKLWMERQEMSSNGSKNLLACLADAAQICSDSSAQCLQRQKLQPLQGAAAEVAFLENNYQGRFLKGQQATEAVFQEAASDYRVLHLAMHGRVDTSYPARSALWFHQAQEASTADDVLHAYELPAMQLNAELVVLSACETGAGKYLNGEGVLSLGRGFMYAGAQSILMSRWAVNDQATAELMRYFYEGLAANLDKAQALRQAKLRYLKAHPKRGGHPFFWAGFTLAGATEAVDLDEVGGYESYWWLGMGILILLAGFGWYRRR